MAGKTKILFFGATGFIGGSVLNRLLKHPKADTFEITTVVRAPEKAKLLEKLGVKAEIASLSDHDKIEAFASQVHVVFNVAHSDDLPAVLAVLRGMRKAHEVTGRLPVLIHTSGTGELIQQAQGAEIVYSDLNIEQLKAIPQTAIHRNVDLAVINADEQGYARTHIVMPSVVYAIASGPVFDTGIAKRVSLMDVALIKAALDRRRSGMVGLGKAMWPYVHVDDVADLYIVLFDAITSNPHGVGHGWEGFYFAENGHNSWFELGKAIGQALVDLGLTDNAEPTSFTDQELVKYWGSVIFGSFGGTNCRCHADRARAIGWKPRYFSADIFASIKPAIELQLRVAQEKGEIDFSYERSISQQLQDATEPK